MKKRILPEAELIIKAVKNAGVVGAGGAGFPTHVKYNANVDSVIVNAAECEPLLRVDQQLAYFYPEKLVYGLELACLATGASRGIIAIKSKYKKAISSLQNVINGRNKKDLKIELYFLGNFYPAGDEHLIVYEVTGRIVPEGGIPLEVGVVVNNVHTLINVSGAMEGFPVTERPLTITGAVKNPVTVNLPLGTSIEEALNITGGPSIDRYSVISGGPMMGKIVSSLSDPVTKTTSGLIVLPETHSLIVRMSQKQKAVRRMAAEVCCSCRVCSDMCPRHMLGHNLRPHRVMRAVYLGNPPEDHTQAFLCVECSACEIACFMGLSPKRVFMDMKKDLWVKGVKNPHRRRELEADKMREERKIPVKRLISQLNLSEFEHDAPFTHIDYEPEKVFIPLKQHIGAGAVPVVKTGDKVEKGQVIGEIPEGAMGARIHASISGTVTEINNCIIIVKREA